MKKVHIKYGSVELDIETDDLAADLATVMAAIERFGSQPLPRPTLSDLSQDRSPDPAGSVSSQHMNSYVAKLAANTGRKILQAAAYHLTLNDGKDSFTREELFGRARDAREWKSDYGNQQATNLARMVKAGELIERASGVFTVPQKQLDLAVQALNS